ncbi:5-formyltetrahydrofolate cyclo-ligase [Bacillus dakarensis]|uniref:5-formyltetrahydrofolate cyclo-ligase n=1 Tax=Robertmurraya dakarensis TaxID=1926278 RepID=UPI00098163A7|nr:5-formyltetrahydrofolate cyclo-ligase [Bacillus dakarensis]
MKEKSILRKQLQQKLKDISKPEYEHLSYKISQALFSDPYWTDSETIGITISKFPEVDTYQIIRRAWEEKKTIVIPKCLPKQKEMDFRALTAFNQLESVYYGLFEPIETQTEFTEKEKIDLLIVPGLGFTRNGYRLGFGGGYYDRFLKNYNGKTLSLAFHQQLVEELPIEEHDIPVLKIITDQEILTINE